MSKHNNNLSPSASGRCHCGRYMTIGEEHGGVSYIGYECSNCSHRRSLELFKLREEEINLFKNN